jgi:hypothetical protein
MSTSTTNGQGQGRGPGRGRGRGPGRGRGSGRGRGGTAAGRSNAGRGNAATSTKVPFENSHILHLFRKIMLAAWRAHQATVINGSLERVTLPMTLVQIRAKLNNNTVKTSRTMWQRNW